MDIYFIMGLLGLSLILIAFFIENIGKGGKNRINYNILNLIGSFFLLLYAFNQNTIIFMFLNGFWILIALYFIYRHYFVKP